MAYPTLACKLTGLHAPAFGFYTPPAPLQFNTVVVENSSGVWQATFFCDPDLSSFLPSQNYAPLSAENFAELWPTLVIVLLLGFGIKCVRWVFE